jgi:hemerythrin-like domain-containing protein
VEEHALGYGRLMPTKTKTSTTRRRAASRPTGRRTDAIAFLKGEHRAVEKLFSRFERAGDGATKEKRKLVDEMIAALSRHAAIEELVLYPWARENIEDEDDQVLESLEEHHVVKWLLWELEDLPATDERFDAKVTVMMENVRHHVREEESELFPDLRDVATRTELLDLADALEAARRRAPTRPHPRGPDMPPANAITVPLASALDRARDAGRDAASRIGLGS